MRKIFICFVCNDCCVPSEVSNIPTNEEVERSKVFVNFINILFAIVLGQSFVLITLSNEQGGFKELFMNPAANVAPISTLFLSYTLVITSFVGYNVSTKEFPIRYPWRFVIDIILLFTYFALFTTTTNFGLVLLLYSAIFFLYSLWNVVRLVEYRSLVDIKGQLCWRTIYCFIFFAVFIIALIVFNTFRSEFTAGMITTGALVAFILYRILKRPMRTHKTPVQNENYNDLA
jgi:multisubunit Na+/H+ antiporter MnhE subunit